ncbi:N-6 DNA methylase [bacterium]|nr:N-6 DNA methylase [bacterium]
MIHYQGIIRKRVIEENLLDAIIGLPENLFFGTSMPACLLVIKKNRTDCLIYPEN